MSAGTYDKARDGNTWECGNLGTLGTQLQPKDVNAERVY
jgi:hypothetical protein